MKLIKWRRKGIEGVEEEILKPNRGGQGERGWNTDWRTGARRRRKRKNEGGRERKKGRREKGREAGKAERMGGREKENGGRHIKREKERGKEFGTKRECMRRKEGNIK